MDRFFKMLLVGLFALLPRYAWAAGSVAAVGHALLYGALIILAICVVWILIRKVIWPNLPATVGPFGWVVDVLFAIMVLAAIFWMASSVV